MPNREYLATRKTREEILSSRARYLRMVDAGAPPETLGELVARYLQHVKETYPERAGERSNTYTNTKNAVDIIAGMTGDVTIVNVKLGIDAATATSTHSAIGTRDEAVSTALMACRCAMVDSGLARTTINDRLSRIKRMFRWAHSNGWIPPDELQRIEAIPGVRKGHKVHGLEAYESKGKCAASLTSIVRVLRDERLDDSIRAALQVQMHTGMRPGETLRLHDEELDTTGKVWFYGPRRHKNAHHGKKRTIPLTAPAQLILLSRLGDGYLFARRDGKPYSTAQYHARVVASCHRVEVPAFTPQQVRKYTAQEFVKHLGYRQAAELLGNSERVLRAWYADGALEEELLDRLDEIG